MSNSIEKKILLVCHSRDHGFEQIYRELKLNDDHKLNDDIFDTNDIYGKNAKDIKIDLSVQYFKDIDKLKHDFNNTTYDIIFLVNCPSILYITEEGSLNINLLKNLSNLLKDNGVIITRFADTAIEDILNIEVPHFNREIVSKYLSDNKSSSIIKKSSKLINIYKKIMWKRLQYIKNIRRKIITILNKKHIDLTLLNMYDNNDYIKKKPLNIYDYEYNIDFYFIFKKIKLLIGGEKKNKYIIFKTKDKNIRKKVFIINGKEKVLLNNKNNKPKYVSFQTFKKSINANK